MIREDEFTLDDQFEQEKKLRELNRKKQKALKAQADKEQSPPPEKQVTIDWTVSNTTI